MVVTGTYNPHLVALSILVAAFASYTALDLGGRVAATRGVAPRVWLVAAAIAMGGGIWSMHFIAMLAFNIPIPMSYDIGLTTLSLVVAIFVTGAGFYFINRQSAPPLPFVFSGIFMGLGIAAMHYIGMAAMREHAEISYDFLFVALSLVIAIGASTAALWLAFRTTDLGQKLVAAVVMGVAISGMHYSAMRGTTFAVHGPVHEAEGYASLDQTNLALVVAGITFVILAFALIASLQQENSVRRRAEEALRRSEAYLAQAQTLSHTGSFGWNPAAGEIYWSAETFRIFEYDRAITPTVELLDQRVHPEDVTGFRQVVERASHDGQDFAHEYRLQMPDGRVKHIHVVAHATRNETGDVDFVGAVMDCTLAKETEDRIRFAQAEREQLEQRLRQAERMEAVGRLAGGIAHDFNNILAGVFAYGEMLFEETPEDSALKRYAKNVLTAATRGRSLVEQILAYSRSQLGKRAPVDLAQVVAETLELLRGSLPADIRLESSAPELPLMVIGDATQLHQVVMNVCSNAIQAMNTGGTLRVAVETADLFAERALSHGSLAPGRYVRLTIQDSGSGMEAATLARIFEPFFTTKEIGRGTGLGLSLVYAIVTDVGGAIDVQSALEQGSTFSIYLAGTKAALVTAEAAAPLPRGNGERVLLVEDEASLLALTAEVLERLGYQPVSFSNSYAALAAFEAEPRSFDVVITDDVMPGLTGTGLATQLRRRRPDLPIVLMSGYSGPLLTQQAVAAGVSELLVKPLQSRQFAATLDRVLHHNEAPTPVQNRHPRTIPFP
jgi:NO-binding membrane sensor protein with MHYT domain/nitrogen-specific signal transduction histidine kinase/ActR/RegA family two-component response regulator